MSVTFSLGERVAEDFEHPERLIAEPLQPQRG